MRCPRIADELKIERPSGPPLKRRCTYSSARSLERKYSSPSAVFATRYARTPPTFSSPRTTKFANIISDRKPTICGRSSIITAFHGPGWTVTCQFEAIKEQPEPLSSTRQHHLTQIDTLTNGRRGPRRHACQWNQPIGASLRALVGRWHDPERGQRASRRWRSADLRLLAKIPPGYWIRCREPVDVKR